jgi:pyruvate ferredoxin oxidoreductase gamma subunit
MYRIRFHGRGGQGMKTASRILGSAFFLEDYEVQDAPRYGAERRGAPIFAFVRASRAPINERGIIHQADLVIVADDSLIAVPAAGVLAGVTTDTVLLIYSDTDAQTWTSRLNFAGTVFVLPPDQAVADPLQQHYVGTGCAGAAAQLLGVISRQHLQQAIELELAGQHRRIVVDENIEYGLRAFDAMQAHKGCVKQGRPISVNEYQSPDWFDLPFEAARLAAPAIHAALTSEKANTGLWRTMRPVIDYQRCNRCWWVCSTFCPDGAITVTAGNYPQIDYDHCKGCMVCVTQCPPHAISSVPEIEAAQHFMEEAPA